MATLAIVNPRRRRRRKARKARRSRKHNPIMNLRRRRKSRRSRRHAKVGYRRRQGGFVALSPTGLMSSAKHTLKAAAPAAVGAVALDVLWAHLPLPAVVRGGYVQYVAKGAGAVLLGALAGKFLGRDVGSKVALGGVTIVLYNLTRQLVGSMLPGVALGGDDFPAMGYYGSAPAVSGMGEYVNALPDYYGSNYGSTGNFAGMGEYVSGDNDN